MHHSPTRARAAIFAAATMASVIVAGCAGSDAIDSGPKAGLSCVDDSVECISRRQASLRHYVGQQDRAWIKEPANAEAYASGVRLFALKRKKSELTCEELKHARREAEAAPGVLRGPDGAKLKPAQVSRGALLAAEVSKELDREHARRCKKV